MLHLPVLYNMEKSNHLHGILRIIVGDKVKLYKKVKYVYNFLSLLIFYEKCIE